MAIESKLAIALNPKSADAYYNRGNLKDLKFNDVQGALSDYNQATALNPKYADAYNRRGFLKFLGLKDKQGAISDIRQALTLYQQQGKQQDIQRTIARIDGLRQFSLDLGKCRVGDAYHLCFSQF